MYGARSSSWYRLPATYAVPGACGDASIRLTRVNSGMSGGVTLAHVFPPSRVTCTRPSSDPTQIVSRSWRDGAMVKIVA